MTAACKTESKYEDRPGEEAWVKSVQVQGEDEIVMLREQIAQLWVAMQKSPVRATSNHPRQSCNRNSENRNVNNTTGNGYGQNHHERHDCSMVKMFLMCGMGTPGPGVSMHSFK